ncbi:MAG: hypothetical protein SF182_12780 [Deltaproteobacteria bacterium]|nr:hypothetical protein [Deltaproteobacteria bacterium]
MIAPLGIALWLLAAPPTTGEFQVNTGTAGDQAYPAACVDSQGRGVVAWESRGSDGHGNAVVSRRVDRGALALSDEVLVNQTTHGDQQAPALACAPDGGFVVVWESRGRDGDDFDIAARRFDASGAPRGAEALVNTQTGGRQRGASACADGDGGFVVAWQSDALDGDGYGVAAQRFDGAGARQGGEVAVNQTGAESQEHPALACAPDGGFVVVWQSRAQDGDSGGIFARRFGADGTAAGDETRVNATTAGNQQHPAIAPLPGGGFIVAWESLDGQDGDGAGVFGRRLDADGAPRGDEIGLASVTAFDQEQPALTATPDGFLAAWSSYSDGDDVGVFARRFDRAGRPSGAEFAVNLATAGIQGALSDEPHPLAAAAGRNGDVLLAWHSTRLRGAAPDGDGLGIFARGGALAPGCAGDCNGDRTVSIAELIAGVGLALADGSAAACLALDLDFDDRVSIGELIGAVAAALNGCDSDSDER